MKQSTKYLALVYAMFVVIKIMLSFSTPTLSIYNDEYLYLKLAQSIAEGSYNIHGTPSNEYPPLYSLVIAPAQLITRTSWAFIITKIINTLVSTAVIFPAFFLLKKFLTERQSLIGTSIAMLHPSVFAFSPYLMSENLFYTLVLCAILIMINAIKTQKIHLHISTGMVLGAVFLTRALGLLLVPVYIIAQGVYMIKREKKLRKTKVINLVMALCVAGIFIISWMLYNITFASDNPLGVYTKEATIPSREVLPQMALWIILYSAVLTISTAIIFPAAALRFMKNEKSEEGRILAIIMGAMLIIFLLAGANHSIHSNIKTPLTWILGRPIGRYIDALGVPLILTGFIGIIKNGKKMTTPMLVCSSVALLSLPVLMYFNLGPVNNLSLAAFEGLKRVIDGIAGQAPSTLAMSIAAMILIGWATILLATQKRKIMLMITLIFFIITNIAALAGTYYNAATWNDHQQIKLSRWVNENISQEKTIAIDKEECAEGDVKHNTKNLCHLEGHTAAIGTWIRNPIIITEKPESGDYVISAHRRDFQQIREESGIFVYKVEKQEIAKGI